MKGILIHIERKDINGDIVPPANMDESINDKLIKDSADYSVIWPTYAPEDLSDLANDVKKVYHEFIEQKIYAAKNS
jgi:hypothetical protein